MVIENLFGITIHLEEDKDYVFSNVLSCKHGITGKEENIRITKLKVFGGLIDGLFDVVKESFDLCKECKKLKCKNLNNK